MSQTAQDLKLALSVKEARNALGVSHGFFYKILNSGKLKSFKIGDKRLVSVKELERYVSELEAEEATK